MTEISDMRGALSRGACRDFGQCSAAQLSAGAAVEYFAAHGPVLSLLLDALRIFRARTAT
jgi:hypothetical protein